MLNPSAPGRIQDPGVNPRLRTRRSSAELARMVRQGRGFSEALNTLSARAGDPDSDDLRLADELARTLVRRCDTRHEGWKNLRDALQDAGAEIPWARVERQSYAPAARSILADCASPGRTPLVRVQHAAAQERARALADHLDVGAGAQLGASEVELAPAGWADALASAVRTRSRAGLARGLREAAAKVAPGGAAA